MFVDIEPEHLTIDPKKIEDAITNNTTAILATHVFGNPCDVLAIETIAKKYNLKVIYDAAHCFGVKYNGQSIFNYGDVSTCSFHATKIFHTGEGGCFVTKDSELHQKLFRHHNFGHTSATTFEGVGTNAKMSELQAAMGLAVFDHIEEILTARKIAVNLYNELLAGTNVKLIKIRKNTEWNYHYYPVIFKNEDVLLNVQKALNQNNIFPRRYFYPSLNNLNYVMSENMPVSETFASRILCLPLSSYLECRDIKFISDVIIKNLNL